MIGRGPRRGSIRHELDARRAEFCRALHRDLDYDPFFCCLGTLYCTEAHGESWEQPWYEVNVLGRVAA